MIDNRIILIVNDHKITKRSIYETIFDNIKDIDIVDCDCEDSAIEKIQKNKFINLIGNNQLLRYPLSIHKFCSYKIDSWNCIRIDSCSFISNIIY